MRLYGNRWKHEVMSAQMQKTGSKSLTKRNWMTGVFYVFDGINYVIDPAEPRYDMVVTKLWNENNQHNL